MSDDTTTAGDAARSSLALARALAGAETRYAQVTGVVGLAFGGSSPKPTIMHLPDNGSGDELDAAAPAEPAPVWWGEPMIHVTGADGRCSFCDPPGDIVSDGGLPLSFCEEAPEGQPTPTAPQARAESVLAIPPETGACALAQESEATTPDTVVTRDRDTGVPATDAKGEEPAVAPPLPAAPPDPPGHRYRVLQAILGLRPYGE